MRTIASLVSVSGWLAVSLTLFGCGGGHSSTTDAGGGAGGAAGASAGSDQLAQRQ